MTALYNKYRPGRLSGIIGQEHVTVPLSAALDKGRTHHAYLLSGPRGCGKTSTSRILAKSLNCAEGPTSEPCDKCDSCISITAGVSIDVTEIDAASQGGVDAARDLREKANTRPAVSRYRIFIIDEAHMVTTAGFNALLKVVEEPPAHLKFIFATTEPDKVLSTIRSRTFQYPFRLVGAKAMTAHLRTIISAENASIEEDAYPLIVRAGGGSVRDTLSVLDQLVSGAAGDVLTAVETVTLLGLTDSVLLNETMEAIITRDGGRLFSIIDKVANAGLEPRRFGADVLDRLRDLLIIKTVTNATSQGLLGALTENELSSLTAQAAKAEISSITRASAVFNGALNDMRSASNPRLSLELAVAELVSGDDERLSRIESALRYIIKNGVATPDAAPAATPVVTAVVDVPEVSAPEVAETEEASPAPVATPVVEDAAVKQMPSPPENPDQWAAVVKLASEKRRAAGAIIAQHAKVRLHDNQADIVLPSEGILKVFRANEAIILEAINESLGGSWKINVSVNN